jgi:hypothetical protein
LWKLVHVQRKWISKTCSPISSYNRKKSF